MANGAQSAICRNSRRRGPKPINVAQWLARIANSYVAASTPEQRIRLEFRPADATIATGKFDKAIALEMRLPMLELQFLENGKPMPHVFDPEEHSPAEAEAWLLVELLHRGVDRQKFSKELPYAIAGLMSGDAEDYSPQLCRPGLIHLTALMRDAAAVLETAAPSKGDDQASIVCLPQNLNLVGPSEFGGQFRILAGGRREAGAVFLSTYRIDYRRWRQLDNQGSRADGRDVTRWQRQ